MKKILLPFLLFGFTKMAAQQSLPVAIQGKLVATRKPQFVDGETPVFTPRITRDENGNGSGITSNPANQYSQ